jgi:hypothetical protein
VDRGSHDVERNGGAVTTEEIVARVVREVDALGLTDPKARSNVAHGLAMKYVWLAARAERAALAATQGDTC